MLNLVQLQERLKDLPMQAIMQYANGANPQVPPFLALGELNRRKKMQESAAMEQAQEMAGAPSIKEQIEQATGLMALQGSRQRMAAQQQQAAQRQAMMPAPNTTTSEPAQLAGGGYIDEVPRDYQAGGRVDPDMLKKLMMVQAMRNPGIAGLPMDMFKRQDYAGGGIVAFENGGSVFNRVDTSGTMKKKGDQYRDLLRKLFGGGDEEVDPADPTSMMGTRQGEDARSLADVKDTDEAKDRAMREEAERRQKIFADMLSGRRAVPTRTPENIAEPVRKNEPRGITSMVKSSSERAEPSAMAGLPSIVDKTDAERLQGIRDLQRLAGVKENPFADIEERYRKIEEGDIARRKEQGMDQTMAFLAGVAEARGGNWATQGAKGTKAAQQLKAEQAASNRRQDLDMAGLRMSLAREADARARGDVDAVRKEKENQEKLKLDIAKLKSEDAYRQGSLEAQREQNKIAQSRLGFDLGDRDRTRQMAEINDFISNFRTKNAGNAKYLTKPDLLEKDAIIAAMQFFGPERFRNLGLAPGMGENKGKVDTSNPLLK